MTVSPTMPRDEAVREIARRFAPMLYRYCRERSDRLRLTRACRAAGATNAQVRKRVDDIICNWYDLDHPKR